MMTHIHSVGFTVADMARALDFYTRVLPFEVISDGEIAGDAVERLTGVFNTRQRVVTLRLGSEQVQLTQYIAPPGGRVIPADSRSHDRWFQHIAIVVSDMDAAYEHLRSHGVQQVSSAPQTLPPALGAAAGIRAFYFRDPDGHNLELIWFPEGKGNPRWQQTAHLFAGIDHTALAVGRTQTSRVLYQDVLGMEPAGASLNYGTEQEHLNGVFGCQVQITGWRLPVRDPAGLPGIGVEFLEFLTPGDGRPFPPDTRPLDLWHWEITLVTADLDALLDRLRGLPVEHGRLVSGVVALPDLAVTGWRRALMLRDADGHALKLVEV